MPRGRGGEEDGRGEEEEGGMEREGRGREGGRDRGREGGRRREGWRKGEGGREGGRVREEGKEKQQRCLSITVHKLPMDANLDAACVHLCRGFSPRGDRLCGMWEGHPLEQPGHSFTPKTEGAHMPGEEFLAAVLMSGGIAHTTYHKNCRPLYSKLFLSSSL